MANDNVSEKRWSRVSFFLRIRLVHLKFRLPQRAIHLPNCSCPAVEREAPRLSLRARPLLCCFACLCRCRPGTLYTNEGKTIPRSSQEDTSGASYCRKPRLQTHIFGARAFDVGPALICPPPFPPTTLEQWNQSPGSSLVENLGVGVRLRLAISKV